MTNDEKRIKMFESHEFKNLQKTRKNMIKTANSDENKQPTRLFTIKVTYEKEMTIPFFYEDEKEIIQNNLFSEDLAYEYVKNELANMFKHGRISPNSFNMALENIEDLQEERRLMR